MLTAFASSIASYQLAFFTPGTCPRRASVRKQILHIPNFRMYARGRPHSLHRFFFRTGYFGGFCAFTICDSFAIGPPAFRQFRLNGMPINCSSRLPSSSVRAVVTMMICRPRIRSILS
jgi:hypothetical protein